MKACTELGEERFSCPVSTLYDLVLAMEIWKSIVFRLLTRDVERVRRCVTRCWMLGDHARSE